MTITGDVTVKKPDGSQNTASLIDNGWYNSSDTVANEPVTAQNDKAKLTIKSGNFKGNSGQKSCSVVKNDDGGILNISGGTFDSTANTGAENATTILNWNVATISGGTFKGSYPLSNGYYDNNNFDIGELTVTGGTFAASRSLFGQNDGAASGKGFIKISGGEFNANTLGAGFTYTVSISGGTFSAKPTYLADGYAAKGTNNDKFMVVPESADNAVAQIDTTYYNTLADAVADASITSTDTIKLLKDTTERLTLNNGKDITLDLDGHTLSYANQTVSVRHGKLTVNGPGTIKENSPYLGAILIKGSTNQADTNYSVVNVNGDVTLSGWAPVFVDQNSEKAYGVTVNLNGATLKAQKDTGGDDGVGLYVNGSIKDTVNAPVIELENTTIDAQGEGMYLAGYADTTIKGGSIVGTQTGIEIRAGKLAVNDVIVTGNGTPTTVTPNGNGSTTDGVGIAVMQHTTKLPINVTISDSKVSGYNGVLQNNPQTNPAEDIAKVTINIESGYFSAINGGVNAVASENNRLSITGGYFTSDPTPYCGTKDGKQLTGIPSGNSSYPFTISEINAAVKVAEGNSDAKNAPDTSTFDNSLTKEAVKQVASSATASLSGASGNVAKTINDTTITKATADLGDLANGKNVVVLVQPYLEITPTGSNIKNNIKSISLNIEPKYNLIATTSDVVVSDPSNIKTTGNDKNAVLMEAAKPLTVTTPTPVTVTLPTGFATADNSVYIKHEASNGKIYYYTAIVGEDRKITFTTKNGFSPFTISTTSEAVAEVDGIGYATFQDAVDAVENGGTIKALKNIDSTVSGNKTFTVNTNSNTVTLTAASGYNLTKNNNVYTVSRQHSGSSSSGTTTTYAVNVNAATNGAVAADKKTASKGTMVTVTASPSKGYVVDAVKVVDKDGKDVAVTEKDGKYVFTMPASAVTVTGSFKAETPAPAALPFTDVKSGNWFYDAVKYAYAQGLMTGTSATTFAPNGTMNRAMIVTVLYRLEKSPAVTGASKFTDVPAGQWYSDAVAWAAANKIVNGYDETTFGPMNAVTREQMAAILFRYEQVKGLENVTLEENLNRFPDQNKISAYAIPALQWAVGQKIINGNADGTLDPTGTATRAQVAQIFTNLLNK